MTFSWTAAQLWTEKTAARDVSMPVGTSSNVSAAVRRPTAVIPPAQGAWRQNSISPAVTSLMISSISDQSGWKSPHSTVKP